MIWVVAVLAILVAILAATIKSGQRTVRQQTRDARVRGAKLSNDEQVRLAADIRAVAENNYQRIFDAAKTAGKDNALAHQAGILQAIQAVSIPNRRPTDVEHQALQVEAVPFNQTKLDSGRRALSEYLVWKFFPTQADEVAFCARPTDVSQRDLSYGRDRRPTGRFRLPDALQHEV